MTYSREVTNKIVECWGLGFTAEETVKAIEEWKDITIALNTVYRHRHSLTAQEIIDELVRKQMRDIAKEDNSEVRMRYRDKLLEKFIPQKIISLSKMETHGQLDININNQLNEYEQALVRAVQRDIRSKSATQQVDSTQTNNQTS